MKGGGILQAITVLGADYMSRSGSVAGLARFTKMTAQPGIT